MFVRRTDRVVPGPGQESVWDYPRPPRLERCNQRITVVLGGETILDTSTSYRVLETSHPPSYYLPMADFVGGSQRAATGSSFCEWKGNAAYLDLIGGGKVAARSAWHYPTPTDAFAELTGHVALYAAAMDSCTIDGELVVPQPGGFYGGWITSRVVGPFKGTPGTQYW